MTKPALKKQFNTAVQMFYQRFLHYDQLPKTEPESEYRFGINVWIGDPNDEKSLQMIKQTKAMTGANHFMTQVERAVGMDPVYIEILEYDKNRKIVPDSGVKLRIIPPKKKKGEENDTAVPDTDTETGFLGSLDLSGEGVASQDNTATQLKMMQIKSDAERKLFEKEFEIKDLIRRNQELEKLAAELEKDLAEAEKEKNEGSLGSVLSGFVKSNPALLSGVLNGITGLAGKVPPAAQTADGMLAGVDEDRAAVLSAVTEMVKNFDNEQFSQFYALMSVINTNPDSMAEINQFLQPDDNESESENHQNYEQNEPQNDSIYDGSEGDEPQS